MDDIYKNIKEYNPKKKHKKLIVFNVIIADMLDNKKLNLVITELLIRAIKLNISLCFYYPMLYGCHKETDWYQRIILL